MSEWKVVYTSMGVSKDDQIAVIGYDNSSNGEEEYLCIGPAYDNDPKYRNEGIEK